MKHLSMKHLWIQQAVREKQLEVEVVGARLRPIERGVAAAVILCNVRGADAQPTEDRLAVFSLAGMLMWLFMFAAFAIGLSRPRSSLTEQITIEQTDTEASASSLRRRFGRRRSSRRARREPEVEPTQGSTASGSGETLLRPDHFDPKPWEPPPSLELRYEVSRCLPYAVLRDGLLAAGLTTQGDREALVQSLARVWKCAAARQRRYLLFLFRRIRARPEGRNVEDSISVSVWIEQNDPTLDRHRRSS